MRIMIIISDSLNLEKINMRQCVYIMKTLTEFNDVLKQMFGLRLQYLLHYTNNFII